MKVAELEGAALDYWVAKALGWRFWCEKRAAYELCVGQKPDAREPYMNSRNSEAEKPRYREVFALVDLSVGFFGDGVPPFSTDWAKAGPLIEGERITLEPRGGLGWFNGDQVDGPRWLARMPTTLNHMGRTPLIAACRAVVASKFGEEVTPPDDPPAA